MKTLARLLVLARPQWPLLSLIVLLGLLVTLINLGQAVLISKVLVGILNGRSLLEVAAWLSAAALLLGARALAAGRAEYLGIKVATRIKGVLRRRLYMKLLDLGPGWVGRTRSGLVQTAMVDSLEMIQGYFSLIIPNTIISIIAVAALPIYVAVLDPWVGAAVIACAYTATIIPVLTMRMLRRASDFWWDRYFPMNAEYLDSLQGMATLKSFNFSRGRGLELREEAFQVRDAAIRWIKLEGAPTGLVNFLIGVGTAAAVALGSLHLARGTLGTMELIIILLLAGQCFTPVLTLKKAFHYAYYVPTIADSIFKLLDAEAAVPEPAAPRSPAESPPSLAFERVTFRYRAESPPALENISLTLPPGKTMALVGRSGAGKTTVASLALRFLDPQEGRITLGGVDIRDMTLADLRRRIAVVSQDVYLFHGSIRENLLFARPDASEAELIAAATMAAAHDFIMAMPDRYETVVGERGLKLSGGERQRIAIARALLKDAPILILDEATSSLDMANEAAIQEALKRATRGRTVLVIAHRLSTIRRADGILVLDSGRLIENGDHESLTELAGVYARLAAFQGATS
ncbi:MAG: ABC transporter ATP-binding protein [Pseudomonadota bacterium]